MTRLERVNGPFRFSPGCSVRNLKWKTLSEWSSLPGKVKLRSYEVERYREGSREGLRGTLRAKVLVWDRKAGWSLVVEHAPGSPTSPAHRRKLVPALAKHASSWGQRHPGSEQSPLGDPKAGVGGAAFGKTFTQSTHTSSSGNLSQTLETAQLKPQQ